MAKKDRDGMEPDPSRQVSEKSDPEHVAKGDAMTYAAFNACRTDQERKDFMANLTQEARHALKLRLGLAD